MSLQEIFASKKFILVVLFSVMGFVLVMFDKTTADVLFDFIKLVAAGYLVGNGVDKVADITAEISAYKSDAKVEIANK